MLIVSTDDVLRRAGMTRNTQGVSDFAASVVQGAGVMVESMLSSLFRREKRRDYFNRYELNRAGVLHLSSQFPDGVEEVKVYSSAVDIFPPATGDEIDASMFHLFAEEASVLVTPGYSRYARFVVEYDCGFEEEQGGLVSGVPEWLKEGIINASALILQTQPVTHQKDITGRDYSSVLRQHLYQVVAPHIRPNGGINYPDITMVL